ncbi:MAG: DUF222 domain-containing protein [Mycobacterium sp.]
MSSKNEILAALDTIDEGARTVATHLHQLRPADQRAVLLRLEGVTKQLATTQRTLLARMVSGPTPVEFAGATWADVLARRLRISPGEAQRRIADAAADIAPRSA